MSVPMHLCPTAKRVQLIFVAAMRGDGSKGNPERTVHYYFSDEGELMACYDPINGEPDAYHIP